MDREPSNPGARRDTIARLTRQLEEQGRDLAEARARETAMSEVLGIIASAPSDSQRVLDAIVTKAVEVCHAFDAGVRLVHGDGSRLVAYSGQLQPPPSDLLVDQTTAGGRAILERRTVYACDLLGREAREFPASAALAHSSGFRSLVAVPFRRARDETALGVMIFTHPEADAFTPEHIALLETFASQAVIAIENARLFNDLRESLEQQTAMSEVLGIIASSPTDVQPVLEAIARIALRVSHSTDVTIAQVEGDVLRIAARTGPTVPSFAPGQELPLDDTSVMARSILAHETVRVGDMQSFPTGHPIRQRAVALGMGSLLATPLLRKGMAIGAFGVARTEVRPFTEREVGLFETFADQAVIAIENARLFKELNERNAELREALERETATAEVLKTISRSAFDLPAVLDTVIENAVRLCAATRGNLHRTEGDLLPVIASYNQTDDRTRAQLVSNPPGVDRGSVTGRAVLERRAVQVVDLRTDTEIQVNFAGREVGPTAVLGVPLLREGVPVGALALMRQGQEPFTEGQIALVQTFADQAVIAIENARLVGELQERNREVEEALAHQTATSEVLGIIARSPTELQPVLDAIAESAVRLCEASDAVIERLDGDRLYNAAHAGTQMRGLVGLPLPLTRGFPGGRAILECRAIFIADIMLEVDTEYPDVQELLRLNTIHSVAEIPLMSDGLPLGTLAVLRREVRPFTEKEIALLGTFADQAVIAIENARLFRELNERNAELHEALDRQTATADVLSLISSSPTELQPVFDAIARAAVRLLDAHSVGVWTSDGQEMELVASHGAAMPGAVDVGHRRAVDRASGTSAVALIERRTVHVPDVQALGDQDYGGLRPRLQVSGLDARTLLAAPMWWEGEPVGAIVVTRDGVPQPFAAPEIALLETFAAQTVIAMQNMRMFHELEAKNAELEVAGKHKSDFLANMSHELRTPLNAIISFSEILQEDAADKGDVDSIPDLQEINAAGKHLLRLINDILDLSKIEAGRMDLYLETFAVEDLLREVQAMAQPLVERNGNRLVLEAEPALGEMHSDRTKVKQALLNLLSNAAKFTDHGTVTLEVLREGADGRPMVRFRVADTGIGMSEEQIDKLFQAFSQADAATSRRYGGTGLGLAITKQFCEMLGGEVAVSSVPGGGSAFTITLPVRAVRLATLEA